MSRKGREGWGYPRSLVASAGGRFLTGLSAQVGITRYIACGTTEEAAEKLAATAKSLPQALKRGPIFSDLAARV